MARGINRRSFLKRSAALALSMSQLEWVLDAEDASAAQAFATADTHYDGFEAIYRQKWRWDRIAKGTHFVNCWYQRNCSWNVYVRGGVVWREEQSATYEEIAPDVPDFNPRGCQKGACYSRRMYDPGRLTHPMKRVGERGQGRWKRISWERALHEIADHTIDVLSRVGPAAITCDPGTANAGGGASVATHRLGHILDIPLIEVNTDVGDHHPGAQVTVGKISFSGSMDDLIYSDLILIWGGNPAYTQIPNAHFINEARYKGARVVGIAPDYNASAVHTDLWVGLQPGSDAALALSMAQVIVAEDLHQKAFIREQTDLPLLVRADNQLFLRESDMEEGGREDVFYVFDEISREVRPMSNTTLSLQGLQPALEGEFEAATLHGPVPVAPVFAKLREQLQTTYTPEQTAMVTGVHPDVVRKLARQIAAARAAICVTQSSFSKYYHAIEMERCQILVLTLCGQIGRKGSGITGFPALAPDGGASLVRMPGNLPLSIGALTLLKSALPTFISGKLAGKTNEAILYELVQEDYRSGGYIAGNLFYYQVGLQALYGSSARYDPTMKRELADFLSESYEKGWQIRPPQTKQRIFFEMGGNILRRARAHHVLEQTFLRELELLVTVDWRMSNTALHSDYLLPAAGWYEKDDILWATPLAPYIHIISRAVEPVGECKSDWAIHCLIAKAIQQRARARGVRHFTDRAGHERRLDRVYDDFTFEGRFNEDQPEAILEQVLESTNNLAGIKWAELKKKGFQRVTALGNHFINIGNATDIEPNETITANTWHTEKKLPWPTLSRRIQFYIDHPYYLEQEEQLPVHKDGPKAGGDYPLQLVGAHTRWSIHAAWRDNPELLRIGGRGEPTVWIGNADSATRGIRDDDRVRVYNDIGECELRAKIVPNLRPGQIVVYHAWEPYQFRNRKSHSSLSPNPINPLSLAGGYTHLQPMPEANTPGPTDRDTRVEVERILPA